MENEGALFFEMEGVQVYNYRWYTALKKCHIE
jgi:hypothetical protein